MKKRYLQYWTSGTPGKVFVYSNAAETVFSVKPQHLQNGFAKSHELIVQHDAQGYFVEIENPAIETALTDVLVKPRVEITQVGVAVFFVDEGVGIGNAKNEKTVLGSF